MKIKMIKDFGGYNYDKIIDVTLEVFEDGTKAYMSVDKIMDGGEHKLALPIELEGEYFEIIYD